MSHPSDALDSEDTSLNESSSTKAPLPLWRKWLLGIGILLSMVGLVLYGVAALTDSPPTVTTASSTESTPGFRIQSMPPSSFSSDSLNSSTDYPALPQTPAGIAVGDWSTLFMKLGFSFVVGFAIAYAVSGFLKIALFVAGTAFLLLFGLQYIGLIEVNWQNMGGYYDNFIVWLQPHIGNFRDFISSNLPSSGSAAVGLVAGFKR